MSSLALLNERVEERVAAEYRGDRTGAFVRTLPPVEKRVVFGFEQSTEDAELEQKNYHFKARREKITKYRDDAAALTSTLKQRGIEPLAIITMRAWNTIMAEKGLFRIAPDRTGAVNIDRDILSTLRNKGGRAWGGWAFSAAAGGVLAAVVYSLVQQSPNITEGVVVGHLLWIFFGAVLAACVGAATDHWVEKYRNGPGFRKNVAKLVATSTHEQLLDLVCQKQNLRANPAKLRTFYHDNWRTGYKVVLPPPPKPVLDMIKALVHENSSVQLLVAAEAGAIRFEKGWSEIFDTELKQVLHEEDMARRDPILFIEHGDAVAILAQYGPEFVLEKEAIEAVVNSEHLL